MASKNVSAQFSCKIFLTARSFESVIGNIMARVVGGGDPHT
jgi:hypothetical protein